MKAKAIIVLVIVASVISGCTVLSFYPLYTEDVLIKDDRIAGTWFTTENGNLFGESSGDTLLWEISFPSEIKAKRSHIQSDNRDINIPKTFTYIIKVSDPSDPVNQAFFNYQFMLMENFDIPSVRKAMKEGTFYFSYEYGGTGNAMAPKINEIRVDQETGSMHAPEFAKSMRKGTSGVNRWICILRKPSLP